MRSARSRTELLLPYTLLESLPCPSRQLVLPYCWLLPPELKKITGSVVVVVAV